MNETNQSHEAWTGLSPEVIKEYKREGIIKIWLPPAISRLRQQFLNEACQWLMAIGRIPMKADDLQTRLVDIAKQNRSLIGRLYKISRRFPSVKQLASHPFFVDVARQLIGSELVSCCHFVNVRIDLPDEERFLLEAHQDFPYIQGSYNGITIWMPFHRSTFLMGPPSWIPRSHEWGVLKVSEYTLDQVGGSGGRSFRILEEERIQAERFVNLEIAEDEALIFSTLLVHRSEPNKSNQARVNVQIRLDDALAVESFERNYPEGLYLRDSFVKTYPEHVVHD